LIRGKAEKGAALPLVLWILAILFIISLAFPLVINSRIKSMEMLFSRFNAYLETYSSLQHGINIFLTGRMGTAEMLSSDYNLFPDGNRYFLDGSFAAIDLFNRKTKISFQREAGIINLRAYHPEIIDGLLRYFGMEKNNRRIFVDSLMDWIDRDDLIRLHGVEKDYYEKLGYSPRNGALLTVDEIILIKGMEEKIFDKTRPFMILGGLAGINPNVAPFEILMSLPDMTEEGAKRVISYRKKNPIVSVASFSSISGISYFLYERLFTFTNGSMYVLKASTDFGENSKYIIECHILKKYGAPLRVEDFIEDVTSNPLERWNPFEIHYWREKIE